MKKAPSITKPLFLAHFEYSAGTPKSVTVRDYSEQEVYEAGCQRILEAIAVAGKSPRGEQFTITIKLEPEETEKKKP